ncbi:MAG: multiple monosaccharide ABC transporter ATP-binding protein [Candidatus Izemoplasmataceae bacterium]
MSSYILEMKNITKEFPGVKALDQVNIQVKQGEIHALCGENGAGKSTLMKVLSGVYPVGTYDGEIYYKGELCEFKDIKSSEARGIGIIHQELALIKTLSIAENIFMGNEITKRGVIDWDETYKQTIALLKKVGLDESPGTLIKDLSVGKQQMVEIAKALGKDIELLILDEPTSALNEEDSQNLLKLIEDLKKQGVTSIMISHKLNEIEQISDSLTVLRDGKTVDYMTVEKEQINEERIIKSMVGREITDLYPTRTSKIGETLLEVRNWFADHPLYDRKIIDNVSIRVKAGEVVGIAGLMGAGRTEFVRSVFGKSYGKNIKGNLFIRGKEVVLNSVSQAIKHGLAYVPEDRKSLGLILMNSIKHNVVLPNLKRISNYGIVDDNKEIVDVENQVKALHVKHSSILQEVKNLSGGNQQKVVLSKWMFTEPEILILDEPTRGIDVGAKYEIYTIINKLAEQGKAVIVISSELPEVMGLSDRIYIMAKGQIKGELHKENFSQEAIMKFIVSEKVEVVEDGKITRKVTE